MPFDFSTRLLVSGCSFTDYAWPTWADYLGKHFADYRNVGQGGSDNANIARNILSEAQTGDTVVVLWTSFDRWNQYHNQPRPVPKNANNRWGYMGTVNNDKMFLKFHYHPQERFTTTMDYIQLVDLHSERLGYEVYHFLAFDLFSEERTNWANDHSAVVDLDQTYNKYNIRNNNFLHVQSLRNFQLEIKNEPRHWHPTPLTHWQYVNQVMAPTLNVNLDPSVYSTADQDHALSVAHLYL